MYENYGSLHRVEDTPRLYAERKLYRIVYAQCTPRFEGLGQKWGATESRSGVPR
jgi:hypothetical protein